MAAGILRCEVFLLAILTVALVNAMDNSTVADVSSRTGVRVPDACEQVESPKVCEAGSRMYRLLSYDVKSTEILNECQAACNESYSAATDFQSCNAGCLSQVDAVAARQRQLSDAEDWSNSFINQVQMQQLMSHWMFEMIAGFDLFNDWYDDTAFDSSRKADITTYVVVEQHDNQIRINSYKIVEPAQYQYQSTQDYTPPLKSGQINPYVDSDDEDFEPCMYLTGYSRYVLCLLLLSSAMFLVWLTCSTVSTSPKHRAPRTTQTIRMPEKTDEKLSLKMVLGYNPNFPVPVHNAHKYDDDVKLLLA